MAASLAQLTTLFDPHYAAKLQLIDRQITAGALASNALEVTRHEHRLVELDRELSNRLIEMQGKHQLDTEKALTDSIIRQMEERTRFRKDSARMILEAAIQVKLGKIAHEQQLDTLYKTKLYDYLFELCRQQQQQEARDYIDQLYAQAVAGGL